MQKAFATTTLHKEQWTCMHAHLKVTALVRRATLPSLCSHAGLQLQESCSSCIDGNFTATQLCSRVFELD